MPLCETLCTSHAVLDLTEITEDTEGGRKSVEKPLFATMPLTESSKDTEREADKSLKNLCVLCASVRNTLYLPCRFQISRRSQRTQRGSRKSVEKPLFETMPLTESTKAKERGQAKIKNLSALCASVRNSLYLPCRFGSHGDHRGHGGGAEKALKNLCSKLCLSRSPQRPRRGGRQSFKKPLCLCAKHFVPPMPFWISRRSKGHGEGGRKSVEKPLFETMPLTESSKAKERGVAKA